MAIEALSQEVLDKTQEELRERFLPASVASVVNTPAVLELGVTTQYAYRGLTFQVMPVSFQNGIKLQDLMFTVIKNREFAELEGMNDRYVQLCKEILDILWTLSVPDDAWLALRKKLRLAKNILLEATDSEVMELLHFFLRLRMLSSVRSLSPTTQAK